MVASASVTGAVWAQRLGSGTFPQASLLANLDETGVAASGELAALFRLNSTTRTQQAITLANGLHTVAVSWLGGTSCLWSIDGAAPSSTTSNTLGSLTTFFDASQSVVVMNAGGSSALAVYASGAWDRPASQTQLNELTARPWEVFEPRRIWVPVSAGGGSDIDITGIVGNATAAGITGAPAVSIDIAGSVASAVAAGITGSAQVATEIAGAVGNATAAGITGSAQVAVEIAGSVGNAVAEGVAGSTSVTNDINIDGVVGNAVAAGVAGDTSVGSDISISGTVGNAVAAGTTGVPGVSTTIAAAVGNATAAGVSGLAAIGVLIDGSVGNAAAAGITGTLTLDIVVAGVVANAVAAGVTGSASVETAAVSATPGYTIAAKARRLTITAAARRLEIRK